MNINRHEISSALSPPASAMGWGQQRAKTRRGMNRARPVNWKLGLVFGDSSVGKETTAVCKAGLERRPL